MIWIYGPVNLSFQFLHKSSFLYDLQSALVCKLLLSLITEELRLWFWSHWNSSYSQHNQPTSIIYSTTYQQFITIPHITQSNQQFIFHNYHNTINKNSLRYFIKHLETPLLTWQNYYESPLSITWNHINVFNSFMH